MSIVVIGNHQVLSQHANDADVKPQANGDLVVTDTDKTVHTHKAGDWHAVGVDLVCAFLTPDPSCPRCHPAPSASGV